MSNNKLLDNLINKARFSGANWTLYIGFIESWDVELVLKYEDKVATHRKYWKEVHDPVATTAYVRASGIANYVYKKVVRDAYFRDEKPSKDALIERFPAMKQRFHIGNIVWTNPSTLLEMVGLDYYDFRRDDFDYDVTLKPIYMVHSTVLYDDY